MMLPVLLRLRTEAKSRWRSWLGLALLVGLGTGAVFALAAGARRTDSAYERFLRAQNAYDVIVVNYPDDGTAVYDFDELARLPQVADSARAHFEYFTFDAANLVSEDGRIGSEINAFKILEGRRARPDDPTEAVVGFALAEDEGIEVGDTVEMIPPECLEAAKRGATDDPECELTVEDIGFIERALDEVPEGELRIVGIEAAPGEFPPQFQFNRPLVHLTPALYPLFSDEPNEALMVRLRGGSGQVDEFRDELDRRSGGLEPQVIVQRDHAAAAERSIGFQSVALWLLAGLTALAVTLILGQLLARLTFLGSSEYPTMRALGMMPRQLAVLGVLRAAAIVAVGTAVGVAISLAASPLLPTGLARTAEPDPGFRIDVAVLVAGVAASILVFVALSVWPAWRAATIGTRPRTSSTERSPSLAYELSRRRLPTPAAVGVGMALEPGRGREAAPVRSTLSAVTLGIAALIAALTFGTSLAHLLDTPRLYGITWDTELVNFEDNTDLSTRGVELLRDDARVSALAVGTASFGTAINVQGERVDALVLRPVKGRLVPPILDGREPRTSDEIVLGVRTIGSIDADVGDVVDVEFPGGTTGDVPMRIVGTAVFPTVSEFAQLGDGALVTPEGAEVLDPAEDPDGFGVVIRFASGVDGRSVVSDLNRQLDDGGFPVEGGEPTDIVNFGRVERMPLVLGAVLAAIAAGALAHLLVSAARRRRRDLAILKTLGFVRRQVTAVVAIQAITVTVVGLVVGVPIGVALGRWAWSLLADNLGVVSSPQVSWFAIAAVVVGALIIGTVIALVPSRLAARASPAADLRAE